MYLGGQTGHRADGTLAAGGLTEQFDAACANVVTALPAAGALPEHLVQVQIFVTDAAEYRALLEPLGLAWRERFGRHYPALGLFEVAGLFDPKAKVELMGVAVIPDQD